jgi:electron transport complex protein RnfB
MAAATAAEIAPLKAKLICRGGREQCGQISEYDGLPDCRAANMFASGGRACTYACLGFGNCARVCPFGAITMDDNRLPVIDPEKCTGCRKCVEVCKVGCIACRICEQVCPFDAIHVENNLAVIDYVKCQQCGLCVEKCPRNIIMDERVKKAQAV